MRAVGLGRTRPDRATDARGQYTRTGDKGTTGLYSGERRDKDDPIFEALGCIDELNASVGLAVEFLEQEARLAEKRDERDRNRDRALAGTAQLGRQLEIVMSLLFDAGAAVATPRDSATVSESRLRRTAFDAGHVARLEGWIDEMDAQLEPIKRFILPSGGLSASQLHMARTLARASERRVWTLVKAGHTDESVGRWLNRLSDYLFVAARFSCKVNGGREKFWQLAPRLQRSDDEDEEEAEQRSSSTTASASAATAGGGGKA